MISLRHLLREQRSLSSATGRLQASALSHLQARGMSICDASESEFMFWKNPRYSELKPIAKRQPERPLAELWAEEVARVPPPPTAQPPKQHDSFTVRCGEVERGLSLRQLQGMPESLLSRVLLHDAAPSSGVLDVSVGDLPASWDDRENLVQVPALLQLDNVRLSSEGQPFSSGFDSTSSCQLDSQTQ